MTYRIAGIEVHKRMLAVVVADVAVDGGYAFDRRTFGTRRRSCGSWPRGSSPQASTKW